MNSAHSDWKEKAKHELRDMLELFLYLAFFFCAIAIYRMLLLDEHGVKSWNIGFALINALVITKVIMIGEYAKLGRRHESKPIFVAAVWKAFLFCLLVFVFHAVEEVIKRLIHGADFARASREIRFDELGGNAVVVFCTFVPLFAFREFRRVMRPEQFYALVFGRGNGTKESL